MLEKRIGFIGAGQMATALALGFLKSELLPPEQISAYDPFDKAARAFKKATGAGSVKTPEELVDGSDVVILAMKPKHLQEALGPLAISATPNHLIVSIVAGAPLRKLAKGLLDDIRLVRVMPNTPSLVGRGAAGYCLGKNATDEDAELVQTLLDAVGLAYRVDDESLLDAVTGLAGSGPAFVYMMIEAMADGGVLMGLPRATALSLAAQTVLGAAEMVLQTGEHPGALKDKVASPAGTTIAGIHSLECDGLRAALISAVESAATRSYVIGLETEEEA